MPRPIPTDPVGIRWFIMHDVLLDKTVLEGFDDLCKIFPHYDYSEYKFYYDHFSAGSLDLNVVYHQSADPTPLTLQDFPVEILEKILETVDFKQRFKIRLVSRKMLAVVNQLKTNYDTITIYCRETAVCVDFRADDYSWRKVWSEQRAGDGNYMEIALQNLELILNPSKIRMEKFEIYSDNIDDVKPISDLMVTRSNTKNLKFHVKSVVIKTPEADLTLSVLSTTKPKVLEKLSLGRCYNAFINFNGIKDMDQFKMAKTVCLGELGFIRSSDFPLLSNFEGFEVAMQSMGSEDVVLLRDELRKRDNNIFKKCTIYSSTRFENIAEIGRALGKDVPNGRHFCVEVRCAVEDSEEVLRFYIRDDFIAVYKDYPRVLDEKFHPEYLSDWDEESGEEWDEEFGDEDPDAGGEWEDDDDDGGSDEEGSGDEYSPSDDNN